MEIEKEITKLKPLTTKLNFAWVFAWLSVFSSADISDIKISLQRLLCNMWPK